MKCPNCQYEHGYNRELGTDIKGKVGEFFENPVKMVRNDMETYCEITSKLFACPSCGIAFIQP